MWKTFPDDDPIDGLVRFVGTPASAWSFDVRGGARGIRLLCGDLNDAGSQANDRECVFAFEPVGRDSLPVLAEQFVRGDELHLCYPQLDGSFALRLVFQPIAVTEDTLVLEAIFSIQTDLLDSHPMIDVVSSASQVHRVSVDGMKPSSDSVGSEAISLCERASDHVAVLLGPHDSPFTTDRSSDEQLRLRLFGDFLEKGVIRKARPWLVVRRGQNTLDSADLRRWWAELMDSPLPLTP